MYITDLNQLIQDELYGDVGTGMGDGIGKGENKQGFSTLGHADTATPQTFYYGTRDDNITAFGVGHPNRKDRE